MLTWRLWQGLTHSTAIAALYHRLDLRRTFIERSTFTIPMMNGVAALAFVLLPVIIIFFGLPFLFATLIRILPYMWLLIPLATTLYCLSECMAVSAKIVREHESGIYDLLIASPHGQFGLHWGYVVKWLQEHQQLRGVLLGFMGVATFALLLGLASTIDQFSGVAVGGTRLTIEWLVGAVANVASLWVAYVQTIILSSLTAMLAAAYTQQASTARIYAAGVFLSLHIPLYLVISTLSFQIQQGLMGLDSEPSILYVIGIPVLTLLIAFAVRETIITLLWRIVVRTLNANPSELDAITHSEL